MVAGGLLVVGRLWWVVAGSHLEVVTLPTRQKDAEVKDGQRNQPEEREENHAEWHLREIVQQRVAPGATAHRPPVPLGTLALLFGCAVASRTLRVCLLSARRFHGPPLPVTPFSTTSSSKARLQAVMMHR